ncbi:triple tyrosine motif-containing protein [Daejeonella lutea]|uniref:Regulatory protein, luxR family n=1 Tax=Daejeonella lutea TaxID=572036 RepID=A0A1T5ACQ3_9SPHI|nr:triple tyrosine motif-containing protein [Daejeonella lutea]SKB32791.1 regulatory protein, luxR family [Daejeonella lutea]
MKVLCIALFLFFFSTYLKGQNQIGSPQIINYSNLSYKAGTQNWDTGQDQRGVMYFGNNEGLLTFDGRFWNLYPLPNRTVVRSLEIDKNGRIYIGGQDEIGYFFPDEHGKLKYNSLKELLPDTERQFADVWDVRILNGQVFFRSLNKILQFKDGAISIYKPQQVWLFMAKVKNRLYAQDRSKGLLIFSNGSWEVLNNDPVMKLITITSMLEYSFDTFLVTTLKHGLFLLKDGNLIQKKTSLDEDFINDRIYSATIVNNDWYALGTTSGGVLIMDRNGKLIQRYSFPEGLQKNNIRSVFIDNNKNLWLGLDDGIDFMAINSAIKHIYPNKNVQVTSYAVQLFNKRLYIGTSNGLFRSTVITSLENDISLLPGSFEPVPNTKGQVWGLGVINNSLLLAHEDGAFNIKENGVEKIYATPGTWLFNPVSEYQTNKNIIAGTYNGLSKIVYESGKFIDKGRIRGIDDPLRFALYERSENAIWASHPYHGIYKIELSANFDSMTKKTLFTKKDGLPSTLYNYIFRIKNRIVIATEKGIYEYQRKTNRFIKSPQLYDIVKDISIQYLKEDPAGNIWFVTNKEVGIIDFNQSNSEKPYSVVYFPELTSKVVGGFEAIYPVDDNNVFIGATKGVFHLNYQKYQQNISKLNLLLGEVRASGKGDTVIFGGYFLNKGKLAFSQDSETHTAIPSTSYNTIHFEYSSTLYEQQNNIEFSYQLEGFDKDWSTWSERSEKDYTNLSPGKYTFHVRARNNLGNSSQPVSYTFEILPAWYQSKLSYFIYFLILLGIIRLIVKWQQKRHLKEQEKLKYLHQLEVERNENEIVKLKNEKLEADVNFKNKELASTTMHLVQRGKVLTKIKEVVSKLEEMPNAENRSSDFKQIFKLLNEVEKRDADWDQFAIHFDHVHSNFLSEIKEKHPNITANELKLCAYLKMNLSSKEVAQLMSITIRAVEVSRYRLRKKLNISSDVNLFDYLMQTTH